MGRSLLSQAKRARVHFYMRMWPWNTSTWIRHPAGDGLPWPTPLHRVHTHIHTHRGDAAGHRTERGRRCSAHTAGWRPVGCVRQHEHTPPTLGSGNGLWSERERRIGQWWTVWSRTPGRHSECCVRSLGLGLLRSWMWVSQGIALFLFAEQPKK